MKENERLAMRGCSRAAGLFRGGSAAGLKKKRKIMVHNPFDTIDARLSVIEELLIEIKHKKSAPKILFDLKISELSEVPQSIIDEFLHLLTAEQKRRASDGLVLVEDVNFTVRTYNVVKSARANSLLDVAKIGRRKILTIRNSGPKTVIEIIEVLSDYGLALEK